jgi:hypothetical protein
LGGSQPSAVRLGHERFGDDAEYPERFQPIGFLFLTSLLCRHITGDLASYPRVERIASPCRDAGGPFGEKADISIYLYPRAVVST